LPAAAASTADGEFYIMDGENVTGIRRGESAMRIKGISFRVVFCGGAAALALLAQSPQPTCRHCQATYIPVSELDAYTAKAVKYNIVDQQVRSVDLGRVQVGIGMVTRGKLLAGTTRKGAVAEHEQVSEVYHVIEGTATLLTGPDLVNPVKRPDDEKTVRLQNGPGWSSDSITNPQVHHLKPGDVVIIPAGTGHWFTKIDDHITYIMVRLDPDKVTPPKDETASKAYLAEPRR
jgi:mannose-6-phosphate isomerase-like protein (cupin superfamily)